MYYEVHGPDKPGFGNSGKPVVLLHGAFMTITNPGEPGGRVDRRAGQDTESLVGGISLRSRFEPVSLQASQEALPSRVHQFLNRTVGLPGLDLPFSGVGFDLGFKSL